VAFEVIGNDIAVTMAAEGGQLQLNAFEPIIAHSLFESLAHLTAACDTLRIRCVVGITANVARMRATVDHSVGLVTALNPVIGYEAASRLAADALDSDSDIASLVLDRGLLTASELETILEPGNLTRPWQASGE
jgi:aspartate ammonia-lyase